MEKHFVAVVPNGGALFPGRSVLVSDISAKYPVPDWVIQTCEPATGPAPSNAFPVSAKGYAESQVLPAPPPPDRQLKQEDLWRRYPWTKNATAFEVATLQWNFPKATAFSTSKNLLSCDVDYWTWSESAVDKWHATMREKAKQIQVFLS